jgi:hypothetical protein
MKKNEIVLFRQTDGIGDYHIEQSKLGSERKRPHVFSHMWKADPKDKLVHSFCIHKKIKLYLNIYTYLHICFCNSGTV